MKKDPADYTQSEKEWIAMQKAYKAHQYSQCYGFGNMAMTEAGELVIGLVKTRRGYSALYLEVDGERVKGLFDWDISGRALEGHSNLRLRTVRK